MWADETPRESRRPTRRAPTLRWGPWVLRSESGVSRRVGARCSWPASPSRCRRGSAHSWCSARSEPSARFEPAAHSWPSARFEPAAHSWPSARSAARSSWPERSVCSAPSVRRVRSACSAHSAWSGHSAGSMHSAAVPSSRSVPQSAWIAPSASHPHSGSCPARDGPPRAPRPCPASGPRRSARPACSALGWPSAQRALRSVAPSPPDRHPRHRQTGAPSAVAKVKPRASRPRSEACGRSRAGRRPVRQRRSHRQRGSGSPQACSRRPAAWPSSHPRPAHLPCT